MACKATLSVGMTEFISFLTFEFDRIKTRINYRRKYTDKCQCEVSLDLKVDESYLWLTFTHPSGQQQVTLPIPYVNEDGNIVVGREVQRAVGTWYLVDPDKGLGHGVEKSYWRMMQFLLTDRIEKHFAGLAGVGKRSQIEKLMVSFEYKRAALTARNMQRLVNELINELPVCSSAMQVWAMNQRVMFKDPVFDTLTPEKLLEYQKEKNKLYFPWCSIGLSDSSMPKNYILKKDLRKFTPFGMKHHNPMRNLYQTLGMKGEQKPLVKTQSMVQLEKEGSFRTGYNWMTCFLDLPLNFEDQLMVHVKHQDKISSSYRNYIVFGEPVVGIGDDISRGDILSVEPGGRTLPFLAHCDKATVTNIRERQIPLNGESHTVQVISVELKRRFKDGFKFTNLHGNKGIATFVDCGEMFDPVRKKHVDIDIIVSAKTIKNRRNFGQSFEALSTLLSGPEKTNVIADDYYCDINKVKNCLTQAGVSEDATCIVDVPNYGRHRAICGWVFWGLVKEPEDSIWEKPDVVRTNQTGVRVSGVKISHIEMRGLVTQFGPGSYLVDEILSYQEGVDVAGEYLKVLRSLKGQLPEGVKVVNWDQINPVDQANGFFHTTEELTRTICDENLAPEGFGLKLPGIYKTFIHRDIQKGTKEGIGIEVPTEPGELLETDTIYIPFVELRRPWQHQSGLWGISDLAGMINNILLACQSETVEQTKTVKSYFYAAGKKLSTKNGMVSKYCMSVRYPNSVKATASVSDKLPKNTIEIHEDMAKNLGVNHGDVVLTERFPCLGFMSLRPQRVSITSDDSCKYVIRVSGSSLTSQNLDFDGDVLFLMSFHTQEAKDELEYHFRFPNPAVSKYIEEASNRKLPVIAEATLEDLTSWSLNNGQPPMTFAPLTSQISSEIAGALIGIKTGTGTSVALGYNLSRISEGHISYDDTENSAGVEVILDKVANSVFGAKHRITQLLERL